MRQYTRTAPDVGLGATVNLLTSRAYRHDAPALG